MTTAIRTPRGASQGCAGFMALWIVLALFVAALHGPAEAQPVPPVEPPASTPTPAPSVLQTPGPSPEPSASSTPRPSPTLLPILTGREKILGETPVLPGTISVVRRTLELVWTFTPDGSGPPAPPEVVAAGILPGMVADDTALLFLSPEGRVIRRVPLKDDPNLDKKVRFSPNRNCAVLETDFTTKRWEEILPPGSMEKEPDLDTRLSVLDRSGQRMYETSSTNQTGFIVSDAGSLALVHYHGGGLQPGSLP